MSARPATTPDASHGSEFEDALDARRRERWDRLGIWASIACALHCLAAPLLFLLVPRMAGVWSHPWSHALIALFVLPLALFALGRGYRMHGRVWVVAAAGVGCVFLLGGGLLPWWEGEAVQDSCCPSIETLDSGEASLAWPASSLATLFGSVLLVAGHLGNLASCRCCPSKGPACP